MMTKEVKRNTINIFNIQSYVCNMHACRYSGHEMVMVAHFWWYANFHDFAHFVV